MASRISCSAADNGTGRGAPSGAQLTRAWTSYVSTYSQEDVGGRRGHQALQRVDGRVHHRLGVEERADLQVTSCNTRI